MNSGAKDSGGERQVWRVRSVAPSGAVGWSELPALNGAASRVERASARTSVTSRVGWP